MRHGSLFSGIGGFDLAAEWMGWENVFHCEWEEFPQKVLKYYWPNSISYGDITKTDFTIHRGRIDILTGGFPCQPYSAAGKRLGTEDDRHLWPHMLRAIREIEPTWVVGENVRGLINWNGGLVFEEVWSDLELAGYEVQPFLLPAASVGAPHRRDRIWYVARKRDATDTNSGGLEGAAKVGRDGKYVERQGGVGSSPDTPGELQQRNESGKCRDKGWQDVQQKYRRADTEQPRTMGEDGAAADPGHQGLQGCGEQRSTGSVRPKRDEQPSRCVPPNWDEFPTQPPICGRDDGFSSLLDGITFPKWRNESIKAYGNAVVPQVVYQIFKAIEQYENMQQ
jgi:DNA (cytosine-5)-methyltransferase 1